MWSVAERACSKDFLTTQSEEPVRTERGNRGEAVFGSAEFIHRKRPQALAAYVDDPDEARGINTAEDLEFARRRHAERAG